MTIKELAEKLLAIREKYGTPICALIFDDGCVAIHHEEHIMIVDDVEYVMDEKRHAILDLEEEADEY